MMSPPFPLIAAPACPRPLRQPAPGTPGPAGSPGRQASLKAPAGRGPQSPPGASSRFREAPGGLHLCERGAA